MRASKKAGAVQFDDGKRHAVVGFDLTFTAPKSVSVLWALADDAMRVIVYDAHRAALASSLEFVEQRVIRTRTGDAGRHQVRTHGMVAAAFDHWDTRAGDPNLHTHVVIANKVQGPDGGWRSLDGHTVHAAVVTVSELYDALLADELARRLPVEWSMRDRGPRRKPAFEVDGIGEDLLAHFSTRAEAIHCAEQEWLAEFETTHGRAPTRDATRPPKAVRPLADLLADWANRARALVNSGGSVYESTRWATAPLPWAPWPASSHLADSRLGRAQCDSERYRESSCGVADLVLDDDLRRHRHLVAGATDFDDQLCSKGLAT